MAKKFCRIIENEEGDQLLMFLTVCEQDSDLADVNLKFMLDENTVSGVTLGGVEWGPAKNYIEEYPEADGLNILADPMKFITEVTGFRSEEE